MGRLQRRYLSLRRSQRLFAMVGTPRGRYPRRGRSKSHLVRDSRVRFLSLRSYLISRWVRVLNGSFGSFRLFIYLHSSEDFDMALRLLRAGYLVRWATYSPGFEEGVSLTCDDEVNRWQKYAYGCSELIFHPIRYWPTKGPFTDQILSFLVYSDLPIHYKFSAWSYTMSYYAWGECDLSCSRFSLCLVSVVDLECCLSIFSRLWYLAFPCWLRYLRHVPPRYQRHPVPVFLGDHACYRESKHVEAELFPNL